MKKQNLREWLVSQRISTLQMNKLFLFLFLQRANYSIRARAKDQGVFILLSYSNVNLTFKRKKNRIF